uniref:Telomere repeat binding bouquet formation protein 2 n=1 Tax=Pelusios castaneus TaxID=367368 RepID=A0A8C8S142_9SAUR
GTRGTGCWTCGPMPPVAICQCVHFSAVAEGGVISTHHGADYLFSSDASHPDTQRIHQSLDYMEGRATVFHSCYLSANASASPEMKQTVALGHFILPPACVQEGKITYFLYSNEEKRVPKTQMGEKIAYCPLQDYPVNNMVTGYVSASEMKKYLGELHDFIPGTSGYSVYWVKNDIDIFSDVKNKLKRKL